MGDLAMKSTKAEQEEVSMVSVNPERFLADLHALRRFGSAGVGTGVMRPAYPEDDISALETVARDDVLSINGISHAFAKDTPQDDLVTGARVLARAVAALG